jgi:hypothetical protein
MSEKFFSYFFEGCLVLLIIISPLFYGSLLPVPLIILELFILAMIAIFLLRIALMARPVVFFPGTAILLFIFLCLIFLQLVPLPNFLLGTLSPKTLGLYQQYYPYSPAQFHTLSVYLFNTRDELIKYVCFFGLFFIVLNTISQSRQFQRLCAIIIIWATVLCLYGLIHKYLILGRTVTNAFSVFGNRNHFAAYMVMVAPLAIGYAVSCVDQFKKAFFLFLSALICATIFLSSSRGGTLSVVVALCGVFWLLRYYGVIKGKGWFVIVGPIAGFLLMGLVGFAPLHGRFLASGVEMQGRLIAVRDASVIIKDFLLFGVGLGNFHYLFTMYRNFLSDSFWYYLHNDHVQLVIETGIIASGCYFYFLVSSFAVLFRQLKQRRDSLVLGIVVGGSCGLLGVLLHSFLDFNFHIPAISILFWLLLGMVYKCAHTHFKR